MQNRNFILKSILYLSLKSMLHYFKYYMMDQHFHNDFLSCEWHSAQALVAEIGKYMLNNLRYFEK